MGDGLGPASFKEPNFVSSPLETLTFKMSGWKVIFFDGGNSERWKMGGGKGENCGCI